VAIRAETALWKLLLQPVRIGTRGQWIIDEKDIEAYEERVYNNLKM